ncbi:LemA family protein [Peptostreptococcus faecalis]|uniref:LemA family protein n=1 Tax=Peptostreptococcus faecalis TaxID=2045015 RepID=UPI000C7E1248|nr:LemA family protein [Peptostreptococcus faecalis]
MKNKKIITIVGSALLVAVIVIGMFVSPYNTLVSLEEQVNDKYGNISSTIQRRADLIPNLVNTVKGYAKHEEQTFTNITNARAGVSNAKTPEELAKADSDLTKALNGINVIVEAYPDLKANKNFIGLQDELAGTENRIAVARKDYNDIVKIYNTEVRSFPTSIVAKFTGFEKKEYFKADENANDVPVINFE